MIYSMTAYASRESKIPNAVVQWEIRSINHRYLELSFKLPDPLRDLEYVLREICRQSLSRGKVDCVLRLEWLEERPQELIIDYRLAEAVTEACEKIMERLPSKATITLSPFDILHWPLVARAPDKDLTGIIEHLQGSFNLVIQDLIEARSREGSKLETLIKERLVKMRAQIQAIKERLPEIQKSYRQKFLDKLSELQLTIDKNRFEQEMVYLMQKMDISEELDRLTTHLEEVERILQKDKVVGRRLDFLMQELNREANTIASKAMDSATVQNAVALKVYIEEVREQIQNLE